jgi:hypothetical protein
MDKILSYHNLKPFEQKQKILKEEK